MTEFSAARMAAVFLKEFQQMLRDRLTFAMAVGIPVLQLILFGYAINTDPGAYPRPSSRPRAGHSRAAWSRRCRTPATSASRPSRPARPRATR